MRRLGHVRLRGGIGVVASALVLSASGVVAPALAAQPSQTGPVSPTPATGTPELTTPTSTVQQIRELKQCGSTMYAVGSFTSITQGGTAYTRDNIFSFSATTPYAMTSWNPGVNGTVNTISFDGGNCSNAYIGGRFTSVHGTAVTNIAEISTSTGAVNTAFAHSANGEVDTMAVSGSHLLTGGAFTSINGTPRNYYSSLSLTTGRDDGYLHLDISGSYHYTGVRPNGTRVYNQQVSHAGHRLLAEGDFTSVGGKPRQQIFMLYLGSPTATVTGWTSGEFNEHCVDIEPFYVRAAAWSPDDSTVYTATTGGHLFGWNGTYPLTGICDTAAAFSATEQGHSHEWINYTGCDSYYSVIADDSAVYVGGHQRWTHNPDGCNKAGPGAIADPGLQGLHPSDGSVELNSQGTALFTMSKANADDMLITSAGLWIASSNRFGSDQCGGVSGLSGICLLPHS
jgi:hypothetical protein